MKVKLEFKGDTGFTTIDFVAETAAEKAILAFMTEGHRAWQATTQYDYHPTGVDSVRLLEFTVSQNRTSNA